MSRQSSGYLLTHILMTRRRRESVSCLLGRLVSEVSLVEQQQQAEESTRVEVVQPQVSPHPTGPEVDDLPRGTRKEVWTFQLLSHRCKSV